MVLVTQVIMAAAVVVAVQGAPLTVTALYPDLGQVADGNREGQRKTPCPAVREPIFRCSVGNGGCAQDEKCHRVSNSRVHCGCHDGFFRAADYQCKRVDPCADNNGGCGIHECRAVDGQPELSECVCRDGFSLDEKSGRCTFKDPCEKCNMDDNAICERGASMVDSKCKCKEGFEMNSANKCSKISTCANGNGGCGANSLCIDTSTQLTSDGTPGPSRICLASCRSGYYRSTDGTTCIPIDRCSYSDRAGCSNFATCTSTFPGEAACACNRGYAGDGQICVPEEDSNVKDESSTSCTLKEADCQNGGILDVEQCRCNCPGNWGGRLCTRCNQLCKRLYGPPVFPREASATATGKKSSRCVQACAADNCKGTLTNPIPFGQQWNIKSREGSGKCCGPLSSTRQCHTCCPPDSEQKTQCGACDSHDCNHGLGLTSSFGSTSTDGSGTWGGSDCTKCLLQCGTHGKLHEGICKCMCDSPWSGSQCDQCALRENDCGEHGSLDYDHCKCECDAGWSGARCDKCTRKCQRGGQLTKSCQCECPEHASGKSCEVCDLKCAHGGTVHEDSCTCKCPAHFGGAFCQKCLLSDQDCIHGGILSPSECRCKFCEWPWSGSRCDVCENQQPQCKNGGKWDTKTCRCQCNCFWGGIYCEIPLSPPACKITQNDCMHNGAFDAKSCRCEGCDAPWTGPRCDLCPLTNALCAARGGVLDTNKCVCSGCEYPWSGEFCEKCSLDKCLHGGLFDGHHCRCDCKYPWTGSRPDSNETGGSGCTICSRKCLNGGVLNPDTCTCTCPLAGGWEGDDCEKCRFEGKCKHGSIVVTGPVGVLNTAVESKRGYGRRKLLSSASHTIVEQGSECFCARPEWLNERQGMRCARPWKGPMCETCDIKAEDCAAGGGVPQTDPLSCSCKNCRKGYEGLLCDKCILQDSDCENGGEVNQETCQCEGCNPPWSGTFCHKCTNADCAHLGSTDTKGQDKAAADREALQVMEADEMDYKMCAALADDSCNNVPSSSAGSGAFWCCVDQALASMSSKKRKQERVFKNVSAYQECKRGHNKFKVAMKAECNANKPNTPETD